MVNKGDTGYSTAFSKVENTRTMCEVLSKETIRTSERHQWCGSWVFVTNFEQTSHIVLVLLLPTLDK